MATNKNQHFVPRCYLRAFTVGGNNTAINLFNVDRELFVKGAPVKSQCSKNYFYGEDLLLEQALQMTEGVYATVLRELTKPGYSLTEDHRLTLLRFWLLQHLRTEAASRRGVIMSEAMHEVIEASSSTVEREFDFRLGIQDAVLMAMSAFAENISLIDHLKVCLVKNRSGTPFVTSDDPAVLSNRWHLTDRRPRGAAFGMGSAGALVILPLTPELLCLGYDSGVYSVRHARHWVELRRDSDAQAFNKHQVINCYANLYVKDAGDERVAREAHADAAALRRDEKFRINYAVLHYEDDHRKSYRVVDPREAGEHREAIIHHEAIQPDPGVWPSVIRWKRRGTVYTDGSGLGFIRRARAEEEGVIRFRRERAR